MRVTLHYADSSLIAELPDSVTSITALNVTEAPALSNVSESVRNALSNPTGLNHPALDRFSPTDRVVIVVSDSFRQTRADEFLPPLLAALNERGIPDKNIGFLFATGVHRAPTPDEQRTILGADTYARFHARSVSHDAEAGPFRHVGTTSRGTPVEINERLLQADRVIVTGAIVLHYFGGFGGGRKSVVPGLASAATIAKNHSLNLHATENRLNPAVRIGTLDGNPVAEDMLEAANFVRVDFILNTVLNGSGRIAGLFCGEMNAAHRAGCDFAHNLYARRIDHRADLVIAASAHTRNFVQTHKALYNAFQAMKPNGRIVLAAPCPEGLGGERFSKWLALRDRDRVFAALRDRSEINGQTALSTLEKSPSTRFVTELSAENVSALGGQKSPTLQSAIDDSLADLAHNGVRNARVVLLPSAARTAPFPPP